MERSKGKASLVPWHIPHHLRSALSRATYNAEKKAELPLLLLPHPVYHRELGSHRDAVSSFIHFHHHDDDSKKCLAHQGDELLKTTHKISWETDDKGNPHNWPVFKKSYITAIALVASVFNFPVAASSLIITPTIQSYFHVGHVVGTFPSVFNLFGIGIGGPFIWAPISEYIGRQYLLVVPTLVELLLLIGMAIPTHNYAGFILLRFFAGIFSTSTPTVTAGILSDLWGPVVRGRLMALMVAVFFVGPAIGPFLQAVLAESYLGWKWFCWLVIIMDGLTAALLAVFYRESYGPILLHRRCMALKKEDPVQYESLISPLDSKVTVKKFVDRTFIRALKMLFTEPIVIFMCIYSALVYGMFYGLLSMISSIWSTTRGMSTIHVALMYLGIVAGSLTGAVIFCFCDPSYGNYVKAWRGSPPPELRLRVAVVIAPILIPCVLFVGWTGHYAQVPWYVPLIALYLVSGLFTMILTTFFNYIGDVYVMYYATVIGGINFARVMLAGTFPLFTTQMYNNIGTHWSSVIYAGILLVLAPIPIVLYHYGPAIRSRSSYSPCLDLAIKDEIFAKDDNESLSGDRKSTEGEDDTEAVSNGKS